MKGMGVGRLVILILALVMALAPMAALAEIVYVPMALGSSLAPPISRVGRISITQIDWGNGYIALGNFDDHAINIDGWTISVGYDVQYIFPEFILEPDGEVRLWFRQGGDFADSSNLYWRLVYFPSGIVELANASGHPLSWWIVI